MGDVLRRRAGCATAIAALSVFVTGLAGRVGTLAAQNMIELPAEDRPLDADFQVIHRVGSLDGDGWDTFGNVAGVGFDGTGHLHILDTEAVRINVVDPTGSLVRRFIGEGQGPGEFGGDYAAALELAVMRDGRVAVYDMGRMGFALFDAGGGFERTVPFPGARTSFAMIRGLQVFPGSDRVLSTTEVGYLRTRADPDDEASQPRVRHVLSYDLGGDEVRVDSVVAGWRPSGDAEGFRPPLGAGVLPGGRVAYTDSSTYAIKIAGPDGRVMRILTRPFRPRPVTNRARAEEIERRLEDVGDARGDPMRSQMNEFRRRQIEAMEFFDEIPVVVDLRTSWEGVIWVLHRGDGGAENDRIDLISSDGDYLGTLPPGFAMPSAFGPDGLVAFVERDDLDVPYVVVRRLPEGMR